MSNLRKDLQKLTREERDLIESIFQRMRVGDTHGFLIKKLKGHANLFRIRKGRLRMIYRNSGGVLELVSVDHRDEKTYKNL